MPKDWSELTNVTRGEPVVVERVRIARSGIAIEGDFELPALAALLAEDQVFVAAFVRAHGSLKEMERLFGVSYPTVKNRLNRIGERLPLVDIATEQAGPRPEVADARAEVLDRLERGELSPDEAVRELRRL